MYVFEMSTSRLPLHNKNQNDEMTFKNEELVDAKPVENVMNKK